MPIAAPDAFRKDQACDELSEWKQRLRLGRCEIFSLTDDCAFAETEQRLSLITETYRKQFIFTNLKYRIQHQMRGLL